MSRTKAILSIGLALACALLPRAAAADAACGDGFIQSCDTPEPGDPQHCIGAACKVTCTCEGIPQTGTMTPAFYVTHVVYAVPGTGSSINYGSGTSWGSSTSLTSTFGYDSSVKAEGTVGITLIPGEKTTAPDGTEKEGPTALGASITGSYSSGYTWGSTDVDTTDFTVTESYGATVVGQTDLVDHDDDIIYFALHPLMNVTVTPKKPSGNTVDWQFAPNQNLQMYYLRVRWLKHPCTMPGNVAMTLAANGISPASYPDLLRADPLANGLTTADLSSAWFQRRFIPQSTNITAYIPSGGRSNRQTYDIGRVDTTSHTHTGSYSYTTDTKFQGSLSFLKVVTLSLTSEGKSTFSHTESTKTTNSTNVKDTITIAEPSPSYDGPTCVRVYLDTMWKTYLVVLPPDGSCGGLQPCSAEGQKRCDRAGASRCEARPGQRELCRWEGATKDKVSTTPTWCGPTAYNPNTVVYCGPQYGLWADVGSPFAMNNPGSVQASPGACITQTANLCSSADFDICMANGATSCEEIHATNGSTFDLCRWRDTPQASCGTVAAPGPTGNVGIWTSASDPFATANPGSVQNGAGACITQASNLKPHKPMVFTRGTDNAIYYRYRFPNGAWADWTTLGGYLTSAPAAAMDTAGRTFVFARGGDNAIWYRMYDGNAWSDWSSIGGYLTSSPAASLDASGHVVVFARGGDNAIWHAWYDGTSWSGWYSLGGWLTSAPAATLDASNHLVVFARGGDNALWHKWYNNGWSDWVSLGGSLTEDPGSTLTPDGHLMAFGRGVNLDVTYIMYNGGWSPWISLGGVASSGVGGL